MPWHPGAGAGCSDWARVCIMWPGGSKMNSTYTQKPVSFPSVRCFNCRMFWFLRHGARTYPAPTRRLLESLTDQPAPTISSHSSLSKAMVAARAAPRCSLFLRDERFRPSCSSCSLGSLSSFMVSSSKAKSSRWVRAFSRLARRGFAFSGGISVMSCSYRSYSLVA